MKSYPYSIMMCSGNTDHRIGEKGAGTMAFTVMSLKNKEVSRAVGEKGDFMVVG